MKAPNIILADNSLLVIVFYFYHMLCNKLSCFLDQQHMENLSL